MNKTIFWAIITSVMAITGIIFLGIFLFAMFDEVFWIKFKLFGWDHFYTFVIIMAAVFLGLTYIIYKFVLKNVGLAVVNPPNP